MAKLPTSRPATYEDLLAVPEPFVAEILEGELYGFPRPSSRHARAASKLGSRLIGAFDDGVGGPGGWIILHEPELHLGSDVAVPDLAGWRRERMPELPDAAYFTLVSDWACEVLSTSTEPVDRVKKLRLYATAGIGHAWLVDPLAATLEVYRLRGGQLELTSTYRDQERVRAEPFHELDLDLASLWAR